MLFAGEDGSYWNTFPSVNFVEGTYPAPGTNEIMIDTRVKKAYESLYSRELHIGDTVLCAGANSSTTLREAKVVGVFNPPNENSAMSSSTIDFGGRMPLNGLITAIVFRFMILDL